MEIFEKIGEKATDTARKTVKFTGNIAKQAKMKMSMGDKKAIIDEVYLSIGEKVYRKYILDNEITEDLQEECEQIDKLAEEVEYLRMEILKLKHKRQCEACHTEIDSEFKFCPRCGVSAD